MVYYKNMAYSLIKSENYYNEKKVIANFIVI